MFHDERYFEAAGLSALYNCDIHEDVVENRTPLLSFMYICVAAPIWRRLLRSFVALARSNTPLKTGRAIETRIVIIAITTSNSISVKARSTGGGELSGMILSFAAHDIALGQGAKGKKSRKREIA